MGYVADDAQERDASIVAAVAAVILLVIKGDSEGVSHVLLVWPYSKHRQRRSRSRPGFAITRWCSGKRSAPGYSKPMALRTL